MNKILILELEKCEWMGGIALSRFTRLLFMTRIIVRWKYLFNNHRLMSFTNNIRTFAPEMVINAVSLQYTVKKSSKK